MSCHISAIIRKNVCDDSKNVNSHVWDFEKNVKTLDAKNVGP